MTTPGYVLEARGKAEEIRQRFGLAIEAVKDVFHFVEERGILMARRPMGAGGIDGIYAKRKDVALTVINSDKQLGRQQFTAAHEYAHHLFDNTNLTIDQDIFNAKSLPERRANAFAAHFLMPEAGVRRLLDETRTFKELSPYDVVHLQYHYGVSYQAALYHLQNLNIITRVTREKWQELRPTRLALEIGYLDLYEDKKRGVSKLPADFVSRAVRAYEQADISLNRLSELLEKDRDELEDTLTELGIIQQEPDIIEGMDEI